MKITRQKITSRGGGVEIDLTEYGYPDQYMSAFQNYLGGGLLGSIQNDCTVPNWKEILQLEKVSEKLNRYLHKQTNPGSKWESTSYNEIQRRPKSAY